MKIVGKRKRYANHHNTSISHLVEAHLIYLCNKKQSVEHISPLVRNLSGIITLPEDCNSKDDYTRQLIENYK